MSCEHGRARRKAAALDCDGKKRAGARDARGDAGGRALRAGALVCCATARRFLRALLASGGLRAGGCGLRAAGEGARGHPEGAASVGPRVGSLADRALSRPARRARDRDGHFRRPGAWLPWARGAPALIAEINPANFRDKHSSIRSVFAAQLLQFQAVASAIKPLCAAATRCLLIPCSLAQVRHSI